jgi:ATP-dependent DNA helicase DinG
MTQNIPFLIEKHFPFPTFNPGQKEAIELAVTSFLSGKKHVILQAPTGIGKSAIATTVHRVLREIKEGWRSTIITATKGLQDQYEAEDADIYSLKGKTNYPCPLGRGHYMSSGCRTARAEEICSDPNGTCTYLKRRAFWCRVAPLRLTNSSFQIEAGMGLVLEEENKANLVVVDECHDIDEHLVNHSTLRVDMSQLEHLKKATDATFVNYFTEFINLFLAIGLGVAFRLSPDMKDISSILLSNIDSKLEQIEEKLAEKTKHDETLVGARDELSVIRDKLAIFAEHGGEWLVTEYGFSQLAELKPVYAYQVSEYGLFRKADHFLHMSATICGFEAYKYTLGIKDEESVTMDLPNPIPVDNRKVTVIPKQKVSGDFDRGRLVELIDKICDRHKTQNGVIHTVSFSLAKEILEMSKNKNRMIISNDRSEILAALSKETGAIILSPSVEKGYDFKGDMCRFQIIPKTPFAFIGDKWVSLNMSRDSDWYARKAILRIVQASGRAVRGVNDHASTYVLDAHFGRLYKNNKSLFPSWYLDSVKFI